MVRNFFKNISDYFVVDIAMDLGTANTLIYIKNCLLYTSPSPRDS